jgi:Cys-tRNA synthase (O-phospho-L-seryl-tRNA:Cys-tRNA synthase)
LNGDEVRAEWVRFRNAANVRAEAAKQSQQVIYDLMNHYRMLSAAERAEVDVLLVRDIDSDEPNAQFDALALISEFKVKSALPALRSLARRLELARSPNAPYDWSKVNRIIGDLAQPDSHMA